MPRTPGAKNKTPREKEAEGRALIREAKLQRQLADEKKKNEALRKRQK